MIRFSFRYIAILLLAIATTTGYAQNISTNNPNAAPSHTIVTKSQLLLKNDTISKPPSMVKKYNKTYLDHLGVMCKLENKINAIAKRPIKIRLGTVEYTEALEYGQKIDVKKPE